MPPIEVTDFQPDGAGGWFVHWRDPSNVDGKTVEGFIRLDREKLRELAAARRQVGASAERYEAARQAGGGRGRGRLPPMIVEWLAGYDVHVTDAVDRHRLNVKGSAPQEVLDAARKGEPVPPKFRRRPVLDGFVQFIHAKEKR